MTDEGRFVPGGRGSDSQTAHPTTQLAVIESVELMDGAAGVSYRQATESDIAAVLVGLGAERHDYLYCAAHAGFLHPEGGCTKSAWLPGPEDEPCHFVSVLVWRQETPK